MKFKINYKINLPRQTNNTGFEISIDYLKDLININKQLIISVAIIFLLLGIGLSIITPPDYASSCELYVEEGKQNSNNNSASFLRQLSGFNISGSLGNQGILSPAFYPKLTKSTPFLLRISKLEIQTTKTNEDVEIHEYFSKIIQKSLLDKLVSIITYIPSKIKSAFRDKSLDELPLVLSKKDTNTTKDSLNSSYHLPTIDISRNEIKIINELRGRINVSVNEDIIKIEAIMPDPISAANLCQITAEELTNEIVEYKTEKAILNYRFIEEQFLKAKNRYEETQIRLAKFRDNNRGVITAYSKTQEQQYQDEYNLAFELYNSLAKQLEQAKIKMEEEKPLFTVIEPPQVPLNRYSPNYFLYIIGFTLLGISLILFLIFLKLLLEILQIQKDRLKIRI